MNHNETLNEILKNGVVAVIRMKDTAKLMKVIEAIRLGGVKCIEITMTVPGAVDIIRQVSKSAPPDVLIGAGWGFVVAFVAGWFFAFCRNAALAITAFAIRTRAELMQTRDFLDHI